MPTIDPKVEAWLNSLRRHLRGLKPEDIDEIVAELSSHIGDRVADGPETTLARLGSSEELAAQYLTDDLLARAQVTRSPLRLLKSLIRWGSLSVAGFFVLIGAISGYLLGAAFIVTALAKPFHPEKTGLWLNDKGFSIRMGVTNSTFNGTEVLGWWIIPLGIIAGAAIFMFTTRITLWFAGVYRSTRTWPHR